jgi:hypothetical protein
MTKVNVFPNPANEYIQFKSENTTSKKVEIVDLNGKLIFTDEFKGNTMSISTEKFSNGFFIYQIKDQNNKLIAGGRIEVCK